MREPGEARGWDAQSLSASVVPHFPTLHCGVPQRSRNDKNLFDFTSFPVLTTDRLLLRQFCLSDAEDVLVFRGDAHVQRYKGPVYEHLEHARASIEDDQAEYERKEGVTWAVTLKTDDRVVGHFGFHN